MKTDILFLKKLMEITSLEEIQYIIDLTDSTDLTPIQEQEIELFFVKVGIHFGSLYDSIVEICNSFDFDLLLVLTKTKLLEKVSAEKKGMSSMEEYFV